MQPVPNQRDRWLPYIQWICVVLIATSVTMIYAITRPEASVAVPSRIKATQTEAALHRTSSITNAKKGRVFNAHGPAPRFQSGTIVKLTCKVDNQPRSLWAYLVESGQGCVVMTNASRLTMVEWNSISDASFTLTKFPNRLPDKPDGLGPLTYDNHPNMLLKPDLSDDLAWWRWKDPPRDLRKLHLRSGVLHSQEPVWVLAMPPEGRDGFWVKGIVMQASELHIDVNILDRVEIDDLIGGIIIDEEYLLAGTILGGNDVVATGASSAGIIKKLTAGQ